MWIVLCSGDDPVGLWAYLGLRRRGLAPLDLVTTEALGWALGWRHRLGREGVETEIQLADGRRISAAALRGVVNRFFGLPAAVTAAFREEDRPYALQELHALHLSWLAAISVPVLNRPAPLSLAGRRPCPWEWSVLAARAGFATLPCGSGAGDRPEAARRRPAPVASVGTARPLLVVGGRVISPAGRDGPEPPPEIAAGARRLAASAGVDLLEAELAETAAHPWTFVGADPLPDLRRWGVPALDALAAALRDGGPAEPPAPARPAP